MSLVRIKRSAQAAADHAADTADAIKPRAPRPADAGGDVDHDALLTPAGAARRLKVTAKALERWRGNGKGPPFIRFTSKTIRYRNEDLQAFVAGRIKASTASA